MTAPPSTAEVATGGNTDVREDCALIAADLLACSGVDGGHCLKTALPIRWAHVLSRGDGVMDGRRWLGVVVSALLILSFPCYLFFDSISRDASIQRAKAVLADCYRDAGITSPGAAAEKAGHCLTYWRATIPTDAYLEVLLLFVWVIVAPLALLWLIVRVAQWHAAMRVSE